MEQFAGKVAVVTGAASGIGRAIALRLHAEGMQLVLADLDKAALDDLVRQITATSGSAMGIATDVSRSADVEALARAAVETYGDVHLVCNNAGIHGPQDEPIWEATDTDWHRVMDVNLGGVINGVRTFLPLLLKQGGDAHIVNTASMTGLVEGANVYSVSKHAVISYTEALYSDLNQQKLSVGVSVLCPGFVNTSLLSREDEGGADAPKPRRSMAKMMARTSLRYAASPEAVADKMIEGVRKKQLYITTTNEWDALITDRANNTVANRNPSIEPGQSFQTGWPWARPSR